MNKALCMLLAVLWCGNGLHAGGISVEDDLAGPEYPDNVTEQYEEDHKSGCKRKWKRGRSRKRTHWQKDPEGNYHSEAPLAGRITMREGTNGVTYSSRKLP